MRTVWTVPKNIARTLLESPAIQMFLTSSELPDTDADPRRRLDQFSAALAALEDRVGFTYSSVDQANRELFQGAAGVVPVALRLAILREIVTEVDDRAPTPSPLPEVVSTRLGTYVYAIFDPRDHTVLYVGVGHANKVFVLTWSALGETHKIESAGEHAPAASAENSAAMARIRAVYDAGYTVEHYIVAADITKDPSDVDAARRVGRAVVAALGLREHRDDRHLTNLLDADEESDLTARPIAELVRQYSAAPAPDLPTPCVVLRINEARAAGPDGVRDLADRAWPAGTAARSVEGLPILVVADNIVRAVYRATSWTAAGRADDATGSVLYRFDGDADAALEATFVGTRLTADRLGLQRWPSHGWAPRLTRAIPRARRNTA